MLFGYESVGLDQVSTLREIKDGGNQNSRKRETARLVVTRPLTAFIVVYPEKGYDM